FRAKMLRQRGVVAYAAESLRRTILRRLAPQRLAEGLDLTAGGCDEFHERQVTLLRDRVAPGEHDGAVHDVGGAELCPDRPALLNPAPAFGRRRVVAEVELDPERLAAGSSASQLPGEFVRSVQYRVAARLVAQDRYDHDMRRRNPRRQPEAV